MKFPFNLGFGKARRQRRAAAAKAGEDDAVDLPVADDAATAASSRTVILDDPDAEDQEPAAPDRPVAEAKAADPADAAETEVARPEPSADDLAAFLAGEEPADSDDDEEDRGRGRFGRFMAVAAGIAGLLAIGGGGWWLATLQDHGGPSPAGSEVQRVAIAIPPPGPPPGGGLNRLVAQDPLSAGTPLPPSAVQGANAPATGGSAPPAVPDAAAARAPSGEAAGGHAAPPAGLGHAAPAPAAAEAVRPNPAPASPRTLNALSANEEEPGAGIVVASISPQAFAGLPLPSAAHPLPPVPDPGLIEESPAGRLPKVDSKGRRPWQIYARPFEPREDQAKWPRVAVLVSGLGLSRAATEAAIRRMPGAVSLAFDPYGEGLGAWAPLAREAGHEFYLALPLEPDTFPAEDPGPLGLMIALEPADKRQRLDKVLGRMAGYTGIVGTMGGKYLVDEAQVTPLLTSLRLRGLMFVDASINPKSVVPTVAGKIGLAHAVVGLVLDADSNARGLDAQLARAEAMAREHGQVIVQGRAGPRTLERLSAWIATLEGQRLLLTPMSALAKGQKDK